MSSLVGTKKISNKIFPGESTRIVTNFSQDMDIEKNNVSNTTETSEIKVEEKEDVGTCRRLRSRSGLLTNIQNHLNQKDTNSLTKKQSETLKLSKNGNSKIKTVEQIYLNNTVKRLPSSLETIFEDPIQKKDESVVLFSTKKQSRVLSTRNNDKNKIKKRKTRIKKYLPHVKFVSRKRIPKQILLESLTNAESSNEEQDNA